MTRTMGAGHLIQQPGRTIWLMQYREHGKTVIETTGTRDKKQARHRLNEQLARVARGEPRESLPRYRAPRQSARHDDEGHEAGHELTFEDAVRRIAHEDIIKNIITRDMRQSSIARHLAPVFGGELLSAITSPRIRAYHAARLKAGAAISTINSELSTLHLMFELVVRDGDYHGPVPRFTFPVPKNARKEFFDRAQFEAVLRHLPQWAVGPFTFAYCTGWRCNSEVLPLEWRDVDTEAGMIILRESKNGKGRTFPYRLLPELADVMADAQRERVRLQRMGVIVPQVFHREGEPLFYRPTPPRRFGTFKRWLREAWEDACRLAGVPGKLPHDFRRTAARNLIRAGVSMNTAKQITGHESFAIFTRYDIVDERDKHSAVEQLARAMAAATAPSKRRPRRRAGA